MFTLHWILCVPVCPPARPSPRCYWSHRRAPGMASHVAMQRLAHAAGIAFLDEASHLSLHPKYGPWFSMRCLLVFDGVKFTGAPIAADVSAHMLFGCP